MSVYQLTSSRFKDERSIIVECQYGLGDHLLQFTYWADADELCITPHLCPKPFLRRLWLGLRYICGYRSRYGDYAEVVVEKEDVEQLRKFLGEFLIWEMERRDRKRRGGNGD